MDQVRIGIIGIGNMGSGHCRNILEGKCPDIKLAAVADISPERRAFAKENYPESVAIFDDAMKMLDSGLIDAVIVATPHYFHPQYVMAALLGIRKLRRAEGDGVFL